MSRERINVYLEHLHSLQPYLKYPDISIAYLHLFLPTTSGFIIGSARQLDWPTRRVRTEFIARFFGDRGRKWLEQTGKYTYLSARTGPDENERDAALKTGLKILVNPPSTELKILETHQHLLLTDKNQPAETSLVISPHITAELQLRRQGLEPILTEFLDPSRRDNENADYWRHKTLREIGMLVIHNKFSPNGIPLLKQEIKAIVDSVTYTADFERAPQILTEMAVRFGEWIEVWIQNLIRQKRYPSEKQDINNFSIADVFKISKALVAICFRAQPEAKQTALQTTDRITERISQLGPEFKDKKEDRELVLKILTLPCSLPKEMSLPIDQYLHPRPSYAEVEVSFGKARQVLATVGWKVFVKRIFSWCALHYPGSQEIIVRIIPYQNGNLSQRTGKELTALEEFRRLTEEVYETEFLQ